MAGVGRGLMNCKLLNLRNHSDGASNYFQCNSINSSNIPTEPIEGVQGGLEVPSEETPSPVQIGNYLKLPLQHSLLPTLYLYLVWPKQFAKMPQPLRY